MTKTLIRIMSVGAIIIFIINNSVIISCYASIETGEKIGHLRQPEPGNGAGGVAQAVGDEISAGTASAVGRRALIVDDVPAIRKLLKVNLEKWGWTVEEAATAKEAETKIGEGNFDLVITDWRIGGLQVRQAVVDRSEDEAERPAILVFTAVPADAREATGFKLPVLPKPASPSDISGAINRVMAKRAASATGDLVARWNQAYADLQSTQAEFHVRADLYRIFAPSVSIDAAMLANLDRLHTFVIVEAKRQADFLGERGVTVFSVEEFGSVGGAVEHAVGIILKDDITLTPRIDYYFKYDAEQAVSAGINPVRLTAEDLQKTAMDIGITVNADNIERLLDALRRQREVLDEV